MKTPEEILEMHFGSEFYKLKELDYLPHIISAMNEYSEQIKLLNIGIVMAMLPTDEKLEDILMDGYQMNDKNKERMRIGKYVRDKCAELLVGN